MALLLRCAGLVVIVCFWLTGCGLSAPKTDTASVSGNLLRTDGHALSGTKIYLTPAGAIFIENGQFRSSDQQNYRIATTDENGRFYFSLGPGAKIPEKFCLLVLCDEGFAYASSEALGARRIHKPLSLELQAWARVQGVLVVNPATAKRNETIVLTQIYCQDFKSYTAAANAKSSTAVRSTQIVPCDEQGRFIIDKVFPGDVIVGYHHQFAANSWRQDAIQRRHVQSGQTASVEIQYNP